MRYTRSNVMIAAVVVAGTLLPGIAAATSNDMIAGGCTTRAACTQKIAASDLQSFYTNHDVTAVTLHAAVNGSVTKSGKVLVDGTVVATNAQSYGRQFLAGSTQVGPVYRRPTSVAFQTSSLAALVYESDGHFAYAILKSCGNLVTATPVPVAAPQAKVITQTVTAPATVTVVQFQAQTQSQTAPSAPAPVIKTATTTPAPTPAPAAKPAAAATPLPQTGASTLGLAGLSILLVVAGYYRRSRRSLLLALRHGSHLRRR